MYYHCMIVLALAIVLEAVHATQCPCGYYDATTTELYTDSIIVYFNETSVIPNSIFSTQSFSHITEIGWNSLYKQGAVASNAVVGNSSGESSDSLELYIDPSTSGHLVDGGAIESLRQDILYGTFRASMRSPGVWMGGSALSMMLYHNYTSSIEIDMLNTDEASTARMTTLVNGEYPSESLSVNYTTLASGSDELASISPWDFVTVRIDWTKKRLNFTIADNTTRSVTSSKVSLPTEPLPLVFKHWSTGDSEWMQGPPVNRSVANVAWVRAFFNSSLTTSAEQKSFDERCAMSEACDVDDMSLRESSSYSEDALIPWKQPARNETWRIPSAIVSGSSAFFGVVALINVLFRRTPWQKLLPKRKTSSEPFAKAYKPPYKKPSRPTSETEILTDSQSVKDKSNIGIKEISMGSTSTLGNMQTKSKWDKAYSTASGSATASSSNTPYQVHSPAMSRVPSTEFDFAYLQKKMADNGISHSDFASSPTMYHSPSAASMAWSSNAGTVVSNTPELRNKSSKFSPIAGEEWKAFSNSPEHGQSREVHENDVAIEHPSDNSRELSYLSSTAEKEGSFSASSNGDDDDIKAVSSKMSSDVVKGLAIVTTELKHPNGAAATKQLPTNPKKRIDYLAGLVTISCLGVTFIHFTLTFAPYAGGLSYGEHSKSDYWARWSVSPVILDPIWLGPFFVTSCRFLVQRFLKSGNLLDIAEKTLLRAPRMLIPCVIIAMLQYFFIEEGATAKLEWLPSITWSAWPYVQDYPNFGWFLSEVLELAYLIPNKAPQIVSHYCVGVLWTVPVQLQFSYTTLLAIVMVKDIKNPWKRFVFYAFCIGNNWYALSWGACFWMGAMLADLHLTYNYTKWVQARPLVHWPLIFVLWCLIISAPLFSLLEDRLSIPVMSRDRGLHPDPSTGLPTSQTIRAGYPAYYEPRSNTLIFAFSLQMLTELSTWTQAFLSFRLWVWIFPHTFTVYLVHGFIFWTLGAWLCVELAVAGLPYWANILLVWVCCYATIAVTVVLLTPLTEGTALAASRNIWRWATEEPVPKRPTLAPFRKDLFLDRAAAPGAQRTSADLARRVSSEDVEARAHGVPELAAQTTAPATCDEKGAISWFTRSSEV
ncbi:hypothetical protein MBLNU459_g0634t1 [Dothideomycetes sp. NU459]